MSNKIAKIVARAVVGLLVLSMLLSLILPYIA